MPTDIPWWIVAIVVPLAVYCAALVWGMLRWFEARESAAAASAHKREERRDELLAQQTLTLTQLGAAIQRMGERIEELPVKLARGRQS
jgi:hypothetical protein